MIIKRVFTNQIMVRLDDTFERKNRTKFWFASRNLVPVVIALSKVPTNTQAGITSTKRL